MDTEYTVNEEKYATLRKEILDESENDASGEEEEGSEEEEEGQEDPEKAETILDRTETNLVSNSPRYCSPCIKYVYAMFILHLKLALRRTIYLTIQSSLDFEECCHKLLKVNFKEGN